MNILIDGRVLQDQNLSGVGMYAKHIINNLVKINHDNKKNYQIFYSGIKTYSHKISRVEIVKNNIPNKLYNLYILLNRNINITSFSKTKPDIIFLPHINFFSVPDTIPVILTIHDLTFLHHKNFYNLKRKIWHKLINIKKQINRANIIVCPSKQTKRDIINFYNIDSKKIIVISHGQDVKTKKIETKKFNNKYVLYLGTLEPRKNIENIVRGFLLSKLPDNNITLILAGDNGWGGKKISRWLNYKQVTSVGYVSEKEKHRLLAEAEAFIYPSFYEGFGLPLLEAMAHGTPVITSNRSAVTEVVGDCAYLINPHKINQTTKAFNDIIDNNKLFTSLSERAKKRSEKFCWNEGAKKLEKIFDNYGI